MSRKQPVSVSFEFFPPADEAMEKTLWESIRYLEPLNPRFVSVTYGADGSTRERTHNVVSRVQKETELNCVPHLTCIGASRGEVLDIARKYWDQGIRHIVALRGDAPAGTVTYEPRADGFAYAAAARDQLAFEQADRRSSNRASVRHDLAVGDFAVDVQKHNRRGGGLQVAIDPQFTVVYAQFGCRIIVRFLADQSQQ